MIGMQRHFKLRPSRFLAALFCVLCFSVLVSIWTLPLPSMALLTLTLLATGWSGYCLLHHAILRTGNACVAFRLEEGDGIVLVLRNGSHLVCRLSDDSLIAPYVVILNVVLNEQHRGRSVLVFPDAMGSDSFRRLRIALRWGVRQGAV
jgi:hypothetical protein